MFDLCYSNGADLTILNRQNLNPLTLAAKLRRVNVSFLSFRARRIILLLYEPGQDDD